MTAQASSVRPVFQQISAVSPRQSRLLSSPLVRTAPLAIHDNPPIKDLFCLNDTSLSTGTQLTSVVPTSLVKMRRRTSSKLRQSANPPLGCISPCPASAGDIPPPRAPVSPIFAALSEMEEPRSTWQRTEPHGAAMEEATSRAQQLRIDPQCIRPDEEHARSRGSFGEVWRCWLIEKNVGALQKVAVKIIHLRPEDSRSNRRLLKQLLREVVPWYELKHPNITPFIGYIFDGRSARMLSKWQEGGNVREYMQRYPVNRLCLAHQIASGLAYLHSRNPAIVHGDIRLENILIDAGGVASLVDFGLSVILDDTVSRGLRTSGDCQRTLLYADPVLLDDAPRTTYTDLWALGWTIYELVTSRQPYDHSKSPNGIFRAVLSYDLPTRDTHDVPYPELLWPILEACWSRDLSRRWSAEKIASHITHAL